MQGCRLLSTNLNVHTLTHQSQTTILFIIMEMHLVLCPATWYYSSYYMVSHHLCTQSCGMYFRKTFTKMAGGTGRHGSKFGKQPWKLDVPCNMSASQRHLSLLIFSASLLINLVLDHVLTVAVAILLIITLPHTRIASPVGWPGVGDHRTSSCSPRLAGPTTKTTDPNHQPL